MNRRGMALIFSLLVLLVLSILLSAFFLKTINENNLTKRYINSIRAFWAAEAGVASAISKLPNNGPLTKLDASTPDDYSYYQWTTSSAYQINSINYYDIASQGRVIFPDGGEISRGLVVTVKRGAVDPTKFKYGIDAANNLCFGGNCNGNPNNYLDPDTCNGVACWKDSDATINFSDLFGYAQSDVEAIATHYTEGNFPDTVSGVTWVDVTPGQDFRLVGTGSGSGVLIVNGNLDTGAGTYQFHGIIYILGTLTARGTFDAYGSTIVASSAGVDTVNGSPVFHYDLNDITSALQQIASNFANIVSWKEGQ